MNLNTLAAQMENQARVIRSLAHGVSDEQARWKPDPESWSLLEVINHLYDEEREDFRQRLGLILKDPSLPWPAIDPRGWVTARFYNQRQLPESLANFQAERKNSLEWLGSLSDPDWDIAAKAPWGQIRAGDLMAAWAAHDMLHIRQLLELRWAYHHQAVQPYLVLYAGDW